MDTKRFVSSATKFTGWMKLRYTEDVSLLATPIPSVGETERRNIQNFLNFVQLST